MGSPKTYLGIYLGVAGANLDGFCVVFGGIGRHFGNFFRCILMFLGSILGSGGSLKVVGLMWLREVLAVCDNIGSWSSIFLYLLEFR